MRITFFLQNLGKGGAQRHTIDLVNSLGPEFQATFVVQEHGGVDRPSRARIEYCGDAGRGPLRLWRKLSREIDTIAASKPDLVVCVNQVACFVACLGKLTGRIRCPIVGLFHSTTIGSLEKWLRTIPFLLLAPALDCLVFVSGNQARAWSALLRPKSSRVIMNGVQLADAPVPAADASTVRALDGAEFVIGSIAMFRREKNHVQQLEALRDLLARGIRAKLLLVGGGPLRAATQAHAREMGLASDVVFAGEQRDVRPYIGLMDAGVNSSTSIETLSLAALECMAQGVPMVMSDIGGATEIVTHAVDGYIFKPGDTAALVANLEDLARDTPKRARLGIAASAKVAERFTHDHMVSEYRALFLSLHGGGAGISAI